MNNGIKNLQTSLQNACTELEKMIDDAKKIIKENHDPYNRSIYETKYDLKFAKRKYKEKDCAVFYPREKYNNCSSLLYNWVKADGNLESCRKSGACSDQKINKLIDKCDKTYSEFSQNNCRFRYR